MTTELDYQRITALQEEAKGLRARLERVEAVLATVAGEEPREPVGLAYEFQRNNYHRADGEWQLAQRIREALEADE